MRKLLGLLVIAAICSVGTRAIFILDKGWTSNAVWLSMAWFAVCAWIAGTITYVNQQKDENKIRATVIMDASVALALGLIGLTFWQNATAGAWAIAILWSLACLALGGVSGFLFGVPRVRAQSDTTKQSPIEQMADWLTKIIVGLGLTNLKEIPTQLGLWAKYVAIGIGEDHASASAALSVILYFVVLGFIGGYLLTKLFLDDLIKGI